MSDVSKTECAYCYELIRYGEQVETISVLDDNGDEEPAFAHTQCAEDEAYISDNDRICTWPCEHCGEADPDDWEDA